MSEPGQQPTTVYLPLPLARPVATWFLLAAILVLFAVQTVAGGSTDTAVLVRLGAKVSPLIAAGQYWRLVTSLFLHIGVTHLLFNAYALIVLGLELERILGWPRFVLIYFLAGSLGTLASYAFGSSLAAGASGAIFGLIGAQAAFYALHRRQMGAWGQRRLLNIAVLIAINLFLGFTQKGIDNLAHLGGLLGGLGLGYALAPRYSVDPIAHRLVDRNSPSRYWPAVAACLAVLLAGTGLATWWQRNSPANHLWRGHQAVEREAWPEAVDEFEGVLESSPRDMDDIAYFHLGLARQHLDRLAPAAEAYDSALALNPDLGEAHWNLALVELQLERYAEARNHFEAYLALNPGAEAEVEPFLAEIRRILP